ncbi:ATP-binding protein [Thiomonas sp. FB-Cd]|uniref:ATP-binding protein n=1 Tax=Thiomonas sp. FB-Cd TaxID=1158292 RepID=UPI001E46EF39|nr:ATP-binding protein [Thiomonas sp. FB-Cd]
MDLPPRASSLIEAMRDIGYSLESAVADILDNSISAGASQIDVRFGWDAAGAWLAILDDGAGMDEATLLDAMRAGARSPRDARKRSDLGRFGLGLKTASFSQCRRLTVLSRILGRSAAAQWDLDLVSSTDRWCLRRLSDGDLASLPVVGELGTRGTAVIWQKVDRLDLGKGADSGAVHLNEQMAVVREHLALVFHRFLSGESGRRALRIRINGQAVDPFDPFGTGSPSTQIMNTERVSVDGEEVRIQPYILPHHSNVSPAEYARLAGAEGYLRNQGFYVYRNQRLIIWGTWFRLAKQEELTKLARVKVEIPNTLDHLWRIDVRKAHAYPPEVVRQRMKQILERIRGGAKRPYTTRGVALIDRKVISVWVRRVFNDRVQYEIELHHPLISDLRGDLDESIRGRLDAILRMVGASFPAASFYSDYAGNPKDLREEEPDGELLLSLARMLAMANRGLPMDQLRSLLLSVDPFARWPSRVDELISRLAEDARE